MTVVNEAERVVASNVFEETDFPHMAKGRVALLGDGKRFLKYTNICPIQFVFADADINLAAHSMTSFFGQVSKSSNLHSSVFGSL